MDTKLITIGEYLIREEADILVKMLSLDDIQATVGTHTPPNIYGQGLYYCIMVSPLDVEKADKIYQNFKKRKFIAESYETLSPQVRPLCLNCNSKRITRNKINQLCEIFFSTSLKKWYCKDCGYKWISS